MRRARRRALGVLVAAVAVVAGTAGASPTADDVSIDVRLRSSTATTTTSPRFQIDVEIGSTAGVEQLIVVRITLPAGLRWGADAPDPSEDCVTANPAVCTTRLRANEAGTFGTGWFWDVVAEATGTYEIRAVVEPTDTDPDLSNNSDTFRVEVTSAGGGGGGGEGGGGGGGGGSTAATASAVKLSPIRPKAGSTVVASVRVTRGGSAIRPSGIACAASIGGTKIKGGAKAASGVASCLFKTPKTAKGKMLAGSVSFRAGGSSFTKRFSTKLS